MSGIPSIVFPLKTIIMTVRQTPAKRRHAGLTIRRPLAHTYQTRQTQRLPKGKGFMPDVSGAAERGHQEGKERRRIQQASGGPTTKGQDTARDRSHPGQINQDQEGGCTACSIWALQEDTTSIRGPHGAGAAGGAKGRSDSRTKCGFESGMDRSHDQYTSTPSSTLNTAVEDLLHRMFWRKARPKHQVRFQGGKGEVYKKTTELVAEYERRGYTTLAQDESSSGMGQQGMAFNWRGDHHTVWRAVLYSES